MKKAASVGIIALFCAIVACIQPAHASISLAKRAKFTSRVTIKGKNAGITYTVWQSTVVGGEKYVNTGNQITTDNNGDGTVKMANVASTTLLAGHNVKIKPGTQAALAVEASDDDFAQLNLRRGLNGPITLTLAQAATGQGSTLLETWEPNTLITLRLNPAEASWTNLGTQLVTQGDLVAQLDSFTAQAIIIRIVSDPTFSTPNNIDIQGLGINVVAPFGGTVGLQFQWTGSSSEYIDGVFVESNTWPSLQSYEWSRVFVATETSAMYSDLHFVINATQECPPLTGIPTAIGRGFITYKGLNNPTAGAGTGRYSITLTSGLTSAETAAHIHAGIPAACPDNSSILDRPALITLPLGNNKSGIFGVLNTAQEAALLGGAYISIQTSNNPGGEIRGRITWIADAPGGVPSLTEWGMIILAALLVVTGTVFVLRRRRAHA